jgi:hypothetical protein
MLSYVSIGGDANSHGNVTWRLLSMLNVLPNGFIAESAETAKR